MLSGGVFMDDFAGGLAILKRRAAFSGYLIVAYLVFKLGSLVIDGLVLGGVFADVGEGSVATAISLYLVADVLVFIASVVLVSLWIHRAHANLFAARLEGLEFTPGWSVGWFFVPIASLFKPFQAMRELYNRSRGDNDGYAADSPADLVRWWGCYIVGSIAGNISFRLDDGSVTAPPTAATLFSIISTVFLIGSAVFLKRIIDSTTVAQHSAMGIAETFA